MKLTASELAQRIGGIIQGDGSAVLDSVSKIEHGTAGSLTFLANPEYESHLYSTRASAVLVSEDFSPKENLPPKLTLIRVPHPYQALATILEWVQAEQSHAPGIHPSAVIDPKAVVGKHCYIGPFVLIEAGATVGDECQIHSHVSIGKGVTIGKKSTLHRSVAILDGCQLGSQCIVQAGAVIGSDGFGFAPQSGSAYQKVPQIGNVVVGDHCEIGAATTIDRATMGSTVIGNGVKLDNQIQVAHNVTIGENTIIAAQTGIAGSTSIGANCMIGGQVGFAGHLQIADGVKVAAQSGVTKSIQEPNTVWQGTPALPIKDHQMQQITLRKLIRSLALERLDALEKKLR